MLLQWKLHRDVIVECRKDYETNTVHVYRACFDALFKSCGSFVVILSLSGHFLVVLCLCSCWRLLVGALHVYEVILCVFDGYS